MPRSKTFMINLEQREKCNIFHSNIPHAYRNVIVIAWIVNNKINGQKFWYKYISNILSIFVSWNLERCW